jgi:hypothetical protein
MVRVNPQPEEIDEMTKLLFPTGFPVDQQRSYPHVRIDSVIVLIEDREPV